MYYEKENLIDRMSEVSKTIKSGELCPFYFLYGLEGYFIDSILKNIKKVFKNDGNSEFKVYTEDNFKISEVIDYCITPTFLSPRKLIVFNNISVFNGTKKSKKKNKIDNNLENLNENNNDNNSVKLDKKKGISEDDALIEAFTNSKDINYIVFISNEFDKKYVGNYSKDNKFINLSNKYGKVLDLDKLDDGYIIKYLDNYFKKNKVNISREDIIFLMKNCGHNLYNLFNEADKLISYTKDRNLITKDDIKKLTICNLEENIFKLIDYINQNNQNAAYRLYGDLLSEGADEHFIFSMFSNNYSNLIMVKDLLNHSKSLKEICEKTGLRDFQVRNLMSVCSGVTIDLLKEKLNRITDINKNMLNGELNIELLPLLLMN